MPEFMGTKGEGVWVGAERCWGRLGRGRTLLESVMKTISRRAQMVEIGWEAVPRDDGVIEGGSAGLLRRLTMP